MTVQPARSADIIAVPYDSGRRGYRMGAGPPAFLEAGLANRLREWGLAVRVVMIESALGDSADAVDSAFDLAERIGAQVRAATEADRFPLILAGNCIHTLGAMLAFDAGTGVVWFDAHGDLNTPATSRTGFLDGMSAATMLGWCHDDRTLALTGFRPLPESQLLLIGTRDLDTAEADAILASRVTVVTPAEARSEERLGTVLDDFVAPLERVYLHIDLDALDPDEYGPANQFACPAGLTLYEAIRAVQLVTDRRPIAGLTISAYDPAIDVSTLARAAAIPLISEVLHEDSA
jgi:arginase